MEQYEKYGMAWSNIERHGTLLLLLLTVFPCRHRDCNCITPGSPSPWQDPTADKEKQNAHDDNSQQKTTESNQTVPVM